MYMHLTSTCNKQMPNLPAFLIWSSSALPQNIGTASFLATTAAAEVGAEAVRAAESTRLAARATPRPTHVWPSSSAPKPAGRSGTTGSRADIDSCRESSHCAVDSAGCDQPCDSASDSTLLRPAMTRWVPVPGVLNSVHSRRTQSRRPSSRIQWWQRWDCWRRSAEFLLS